MSVDLESNNLAENPLSDDAILHICEFLPCKDLLQLSLVDKTFNRVITKSMKMMKNVRLVLKFKNEVDLDDVIKFSSEPRFTAVKLIKVGTDVAQLPKFISLMELLSHSVEDLIIERSSFRVDQFREIVQKFLPKLKACTLNYVNIAHEEDAYNDEFFATGYANYPMQTLKVIGAACDVYKFLAGCQQLQSFECRHNQRIKRENLAPLNDFLSQQAQLKKLDFVQTGIDLSHMTCFQLEELTVKPQEVFDWLDMDESVDLIDTDDFNVEETADVIEPFEESIGVSKFLEKLPNLKKLNIDICGFNCRRLMEAICESPMLENLNLNVKRGEIDFEAFDDLENHSVKTLEIRDETKFVTGSLLQMFRGVDSVNLQLYYNLFDFERLDRINLIGAPSDVIEKIELNASPRYCSLHLGPRDFAEAAEKFESSLLCFAEKFSARIERITFGSWDWSSKALSNSFCERLVTLLPKLKDLEVYNIADRESFFAFLDNNQSGIQANLDDVMFYKPKETSQ